MIIFNYNYNRLAYNIIPKFYMNAVQTLCLILVNFAERSVIHSSLLRSSSANLFNSREYLLAALILGP